MAYANGIVRYKRKYRDYIYNGIMFYKSRYENDVIVEDAECPLSTGCEVGVHSGWDAPTHMLIHTWGNLVYSTSTHWTVFLVVEQSPEFLRKPTQI